MSQFFESRRYSGVVLADARLPSMDEVASLLAVSRSRITPVASTHVAVTRMTFPWAKNLYAESADVKPNKSGYPYEIYCAQLEGGRRPALLVAGPYVRLLAMALQRLDAALSGDSPMTFLRPPMPQLYDFFEHSSDSTLGATQIDVTMKSTGLDHVTLSGKNPLRSELRQAIAGVAVPYAIRLKSTMGKSGRPTNVNLDRHGNIWFYLAGEDRMDNVSTAVARIMKLFPMQQTTDLPLTRQASAGGGT